MRLTLIPLVLVLTLSPSDEKRDVSPLKPKFHTIQPFGFVAKYFSCFLCEQDIKTIFYNPINNEAISLCEKHAHLGHLALEMGKKNFEREKQE